MDTIYVTDFIDRLNESVIEGEELEDIINQELEESIRENNESIREIETEVGLITEIFTMFSKLIHTQGETINEVDEKINVIETDVSIGTVNIIKASTYVKDKFVIARDVALVVGGGILGTAGLLLGPFIGIGTIVGGAAAGGAAVAGIHKKQTLKPKE